MTQMSDAYHRATIERYWSEPAGMRTILYYAYLLAPTGDLSKVNICSDLRKLTSPLGISFEQGVELLTNDEIIHKSSCLLQIKNHSYNIVGDLIEQSMGGNPPPLNGVDIYRAVTPEKRKELWVDAAVNFIKDGLSIIKGLEPKVHPINFASDDGSILTICPPNDDRALAFVFLNTQCLEKIDVTTRAILGEVFLLQGKLHRRIVSVMGAPVYGIEAINDLEQVYSMSCIGPINLVPIIRYIKGKPDKAAKLLDMLVNFADKTSGGIISYKVLENFYFRNV